MPDPIEGASAVVPPSHDNAPEPSFLDRMVDSMAEKQAAKDPQPQAAPAQADPGDDLDPSKETPVAADPPKAEEPPVEGDDLGLGSVIKKKQAPKTAAAATPPKAGDKTPAPAAKSPTDALQLPKGTITPKWFRSIYDTTKAERDQFKAEADALRKEKEDWSERPSSPEAESKWKADLENERKRAEQAEENLRIVGYEKSPDFDRDHVEPLKKAWKDAIAELADQDVIAQGLERKTTVDDIQAVVGIQNSLQASKKARELFGEDAPAVLQAREKIRGMLVKRDEALETWRTKGTEHQQAQQKEQDELMSGALKTFDDRVGSYSKQHPDIWEPKTDEEKSGQAAAQKLIGMAFKGEGLPKFNTKGEQWTFMAKLKADISARAVATPLLIIRNNALQEENAALKEKLSGYDRSDPSVGNKGEGEGRKAPASAPGSGQGLAAMHAMIDAA